MDITFYGVRGSTPCAGDDTARYGGNTASVVITSDSFDPVLLDLGTGVRYLPTDFVDGPVRANALVTHLHWDHVQGLPFCPALHRADTSIVVHGPAHDGVGFGDAFDQLMRPPFFPVRVHDLPAHIEIATLDEGLHDIGGAKVMATYVSHTDTTFGYRIEGDGRAVAYLSDHQQPDDPDFVAQAVRELCRGVDVLIHDAQFTPEEFEAKRDWGHCTVDYAVTVAAACEVGTLVLFHHDPTHDDDTIDRLHAEAARSAQAQGVASVVAAHEGLRITLT